MKTDEKKALKQIFFHKKYQINSIENFRYIHPVIGRFNNTYAKQ